MSIEIKTSSFGEFFFTDTSTKNSFAYFPRTQTFSPTAKVPSFLVRVVTAAEFLNSLLLDGSDYVYFHEQFSVIRWHKNVSVDFVYTVTGLENLRYTSATLASSIVESLVSNHIRIVSKSEGEREYAAASAKLNLSIAPSSVPVNTLVNALVNLPVKAVKAKEAVAPVSTPVAAKKASSTKKKAPAKKKEKLTIKVGLLYFNTKTGEVERIYKVDGRLVKSAAHDYGVFEWVDKAFRKATADEVAEYLKESDETE